MYKLLLIFLLSVFTCLASEEQSFEDKLLEQLVQEKLLGRDSGEPLTKLWLRPCLTQKSEVVFSLECDDLPFAYDIFLLSPESAHPSVLLLENGHFVQNPWFYTIHPQHLAKKSLDLNKLLSAEILSAQLLKATGNEKFTPAYIKQQGLSAYLLKYSADGFILLSGLDDESHGLRLGRLDWDADAFKFTPDPQPSLAFRYQPKPIIDTDIEFRLLAEEASNSDKAYAHGSDVVYLSSEKGIKASHIASVQWPKNKIWEKQRRDRICLQLTAEGAEQLGRITSANLGRYMAVLFKQKVIFKAPILSAISDGKVCIFLSASEEESLRWFAELQDAIGELPARNKSYSLLDLLYKLIRAYR